MEGGDDEAAIVTECSERANIGNFKRKRGTTELLDKRTGLHDDHEGMKE